MLEEKRNWDLKQAGGSIISKWVIVLLPIFSFCFELMWLIESFFLSMCNSCSASVVIFFHTRTCRCTSIITSLIKDGCEEAKDCYFCTKVTNSLRVDNQQEAISPFRNISNDHEYFDNYYSGPCRYSVSFFFLCPFVLLVQKVGHNSPNEWKHNRNNC